jgi:hypothetical protein
MLQNNRVFQTDSVPGAMNNGKCSHVTQIRCAVIEAILNVCGPGYGTAWTGGLKCGNTIADALPQQCV